MIEYPISKSQYPSSFNEDENTLFIQLYKDDLESLIDQEYEMKVLDKIMQYQTIILNVNDEKETKENICSLCGRKGHNKSTCSSKERGIIKE